MANAVRIELTGWDEASRRFDALAADMADPAGPALDTADIIARGFASRAPRVTGRLAGSMAARAEPGGAAAAVSMLVYAGVIEWGWPARGIAPAHSLARAITGTESERQRVWDDWLATITKGMT